MKDNFKLLCMAERAFYHTRETYFSNDGDKLLLRFLKERGLMAKFHKLFNDVESGLMYRNFICARILFYSNTPENETIYCFCSTYALKDYFLNAFVWDDIEFWSNVHNEWLEYLDKNFKGK